MERLLFLLAFVAPACFAGYAVDLTKPENLGLADMYPSYEEISAVSFQDTEENYSLVGFKRRKGELEYDIYSAEINSSISGKQRMFIVLPDTCSDSEKKYDDMVLRTNGQNVRYSKLCDGEEEYITPISTAGHNFLVDEFRKKNHVKLELPNIIVNFEAAGFVKAWDSYGGDAL